VSPIGRDRYLRAYERALLSALQNIVNGIPHSDLSIQFDVCQEVLLFENYFPAQEPDYQTPVFQQFGRLGAAVPNDVEVGFHLCYGSPGDQPLLNLKDASVLARLMTGIAAFVRRPVEFLHIPVPRTADEAFFSPLHSWRQPPETRLYLGLLQFDDETGNRSRIRVAQQAVQDFGVGAECGFGRTDPLRVCRSFWRATGRPPKCWRDNGGRRHPIISSIAQHPGKCIGQDPLTGLIEDMNDRRTSNGRRDRWDRR
jgi:hypothetical protein